MSTQKKGHRFDRNGRVVDRPNPGASDYARDVMRGSEGAIGKINPESELMKAAKNLPLSAPDKPSGVTGIRPADVQTAIPNVRSGEVDFGHELREERRRELQQQSGEYIVPIPNAKPKLPGEPSGIVPIPNAKPKLPGEPSGIIDL